MVFEKSEWIWLDEEEIPDSYALFKDRLTHSGERTVIRLSADSDYTLFVNEKYVASNQYGDYEHYKIYDEIDITDFLSTGENELSFTVYYCGTDTSRYRKYKPGLIYEVERCGEIILASHKDTLSAREPRYISGRCLMVTVQLGYSFSYDATRSEECDLRPSRTVEKVCNFYGRPIKRLTVSERAAPKSVRKCGKGHYLIDLGGETVGLPSLEFISQSEQQLKVAWGEHIADAGVRREVGGRSFYFEYRAKVGKNLFDEYMLRIGCRYLEIFCEEEINLIYAGVRPQIYEVKARSVKIDSEIDRRIYDISVNSLKKSMMEHYVDCPWREQALYVFESRNQMLFGYLAFENGNADYVKSNLRLISEDRREDGLLSICFPAGKNLSIPSFSLYYSFSVNEYLHYTGDKEFARAVSPKIESVIDDVLSRRRNGLVERYEGAEYWNFYDWSDYSEGNHGSSDKPEPDLMLNCLTVMALMNYKEITDAVGIPYKYAGIAEELRAAIREQFLADNGLFTMLRGKEQYTVLGNSMAILCGAAPRESVDYLCEKMASGALRECSLSMKIFEYEALLSFSEEKYRQLVLDEIRKNYKVMLDYGSDTTWETLDGESAFDNAGSLCHGWTAVPIYFYHKLGIATHTDEPSE